MVQVAPAHYVLGVKVVRDKAKPVNVLRCHSRKESIQVPGRGPFPDHDEHSGTHLFQGLIGCGALVVRLNARRHIGLEIEACQARAVTVEDPVAKELYFGEDAGVCMYNTREVHHLGKSEDSGLIKKLSQVLCLEARPGRLHVGSGYAGRGHEKGVKGEIAARFQKEVYARKAQDIGDFMRIRNDRRGPVRQERSGKTAGRQHGALYVDVPVHEARGDPHTTCIELFSSLKAVPETGNEPVLNGHISGLDGPVKDIHHAAVFQDQVRGDFSSCGHKTPLHSIFEA